MLKVHCFAPSGPSLLSAVCVVFPLSCAKPVTVYLCSLLFSLRAEPPSLWTNTLQKTSAPPQNHFYHRPRQYTLTKGLKRPGKHASMGTRTRIGAFLPVQRSCTGKMCKHHSNSFQSKSSDTRPRYYHVFPISAFLHEVPVDFRIRIKMKNPTALHPIIWQDSLSL